jgi:hypothetical protein
MKPHRVFLFAVMLMACGCKEQASYQAGPRPDAAPAFAQAARKSAGSAEAPAAPSPVAAAGQMDGSAPGTRPPVSVPSDRKIVRNGSLELEVASLDKALAGIRAETERVGGYITNESQRRNEYGARQGAITCRLPAGKLDAALGVFQALGRTESVNVQADDITEQYFNLEIRLRNQQQLEERLVKLLDNPGNKVVDLLEVEREVARVRGEIDELEGRRRFWDSQVSFSTLTVELREPRPVISGGGGGVRVTLTRAARQAGENLVGTVAWLIASLGVFVPASLVCWLCWRGWKALRGRRKG